MLKGEKVLRGRPKNPITQKTKLDRERRSLIRNLRDRGLSEGYAQGMNIHTLANLFDKAPAVAYQRVKTLKNSNPSIEVRREEALKKNKLFGIKKPKEASLISLERRARKEAQKNAKALLRAKNQEGVLKRNALIAERYSRGAIGGDLINGMGIAIVDGITIARKAAEKDPVLEYKRNLSLQRLQKTEVYSQKSVAKALGWIRSDLVTLGETIAKREHIPSRSIAEIRSSVGTKGKENMRKEVLPNDFMQKNKLGPKTMNVLSNAFFSSFRDANRAPKNAFEILGVLRSKVPSLPESILTSYSNWVFTFIQNKENEQKLIEFLKQVK